MEPTPAPGGLDLKDSTGVVVRAAHQGGILDILDTGGIQIALDLLVVLAALIAQVVTHQQASAMISRQWSFLQSKARSGLSSARSALHVTHLVCVIEDELLDLLAVSRTALGVTHRVDEQTKLGKIEAQALVELHRHDDALGVCRRIGSAEPLDAHLVELAQAAVLGTLAAEHEASA